MVSSAAVTPSSGQPALRASCDNCHRSKVKCAYADGGCPRCRSLGLPCVRSPPLKCGRQPHSHANSQKSPILYDAKAHAARQQLRRGARSQARRPDPPPSRQPSIAVHRLTPPLDGVLDPQPEPAAFGLSTPVSLEDFIQSEFSWMNMDMDLPPDNPAASAAPDMFFDLLSAVDVAPPSPPALLPPSFATPPATVPVAHMQPARQHPHPSAAPIAPSSTTLPEAGPTTCNCFVNIISKLEELQGSNIRATPLDQALARNKEAMATVCIALRCTHSHDGTLVLLFIILLRKIMLLYREAYHIRVRNQLVTAASPVATSPTTSSSMPASSASSPSTDPASPAVLDPIVQVQLGTYTLDQADEAVLKREILLLDLRKISSLMDRLDRRAEHHDDRDCLKVYAAIRPVLWRDFHFTIDHVQS